MYQKPEGIDIISYWHRLSVHIYWNIGKISYQSITNLDLFSCTVYTTIIFSLFISQTGVVVVTQQPAFYVPVIHPAGDHYRILSIINCILCCFFGSPFTLLCTIPAIIISFQVRYHTYIGTSSRVQTIKFHTVGSGVGLGGVKGGILLSSPPLNFRPKLFHHATASQLQAFWGPKSHQSNLRETDLFPSQTMKP